MRCLHVYISFPVLVCKQFNRKPKFSLSLSMIEMNCNNIIILLCCEYNIVIFIIMYSVAWQLKFEWPICIYLTVGDGGGHEV